MTDSDVREDVRERSGVREHRDPGDRERFAHIVFAPGRDASAVVLEAQVTGTPVEALCGKKWVPSRDPKRFPVCPECKQIAGRVPQR